MVDLNFWRKDHSEPNQSNNENIEYQYSPESENNSDPSHVIKSPEYYQAEPADPQKAVFYNNISRWAIYVGAFLMPLFFLPWTSNTLGVNKQMLLVVIASIGLVSWLLGIVSSGNLTWRRNNVDKAVLGFLVASIIGAVFSIDKFKSIFGFSGTVDNPLIVMVALTIIYFLIVNNTEDKGKTVASLLGLSIFIALIYGLLQIFGVYILKFPFATSRAFNTLG